MSEQLIDVPKMHEDHRKWKSEHSMWQQDLRSWKKQIQQGLIILDELQRLFKDQQQMLVEQTGTLESQEQRFQSHEHDLVSWAKLGVEYRESFTQKHREMGKQIEQTRQDLERIKKQHHNVIARLWELEKSMNPPA